MAAGLSNNVTHRSFAKGLMSSSRNTYPTEPESPLTEHQVAQAIEVYAESLDCPECGHQIPLSTETLTWNIRSPNDVASRLLARYGQLERESLVVLTLNTKNYVLDEREVYRGSVSASHVRIAELFSEAVKRHASSIIVCHNHPSGDPTPSPDDLHLTAETLAAGRLLDIAVLDHLVLGNGQYVSLRDRGIAFDRPSQPVQP